MSLAISSDVGTSKLYEDAATRVWMLDLAPGEATKWHRHDCDYAFVVTMTGRVQTQYLDGSVEDQFDDPVGAMQYRAQDQPHRLVNTGTTRYQNVVIEFKDRVGSTA